MNSPVQDLPVIPGLVLLAETGRDAVARRFRVQAERPVTLLWFSDVAAAKSIVAEANAFATQNPSGFAPVLRAFLQEGRAGVLLGCERAEDAFDAPPIGEDALLSRIRPIVAGLLGLVAAGRVHGRLRRSLIVQHDGSWLALPPFCVAADRDESPDGAARRDLLAIVELVVHAVCGARLSSDDLPPPDFAATASPRLLAAVKRIAAAAKSGADGYSELEGSYLAPREGVTGGARSGSKVEAERSSRRTLYTVLALAAPAAVLVVMLAAGGFERAKGFLRFDPGAPEPVGRTPVGSDSGASGPAVPATSSKPAEAPPPAIDDSAETRALAEKILGGIRSSVKPAPAPPTRDPELVAAENLEAEGKKLLQDVRDKKVETAKRNQTLAVAIEKLETARTKLEALSEQNPSLQRQLEVALEDLNALIINAYKLKTRD